MTQPIRSFGRTAFPLLAALAAVAIVAFTLAPSWAGHFGFGNNSVGGVSITPDGVLGNADQASIAVRVQDLERQLQNQDAELEDGTRLRMISLRGLEEAIRDAQENSLGELPDEVKYLCGIQRIQYVFVYPERNDIVIAGPAEGWRVDDRGNIVGVTTGMPVIQLDDLLVALRTVETARQGGLSCSIQPTPEGRQAMQDYISRQGRFHAGVARGVEEAMGAQEILLYGVPEDSHFARVLVAADYKMKRLAMNLDESPVIALSQSYLERLRRPSGNMMPRWWMACNYDSLGRTEDGLGWELRGQGVKTMTEMDFISEEGEAQASGQTDALAQKWADDMTASYDELCVNEPVFGELRNIMDMCVISAIIQRENLLEKAGCELPLLYGAEEGLATYSWNVPRSVATYCSIVQRGNDFIISASGGVAINSWAAAANNEVSDKTADVRVEATAPEGSNWWWNASS